MLTVNSDTILKAIAAVLMLALLLSLVVWFASMLSETIVAVMAGGILMLIAGFPSVLFIIYTMNHRDDEQARPTTVITYNVDARSYTENRMDEPVFGPVFVPPYQAPTFTMLQTQPTPTKYLLGDNTHEGV